jgi:hypothetical protein
VSLQYKICWIICSADCLITLGRCLMHINLGSSVKSIICLSSRHHLASSVTIRVFIWNVTSGNSVGGTVWHPGKGPKPQSGSLVVMFSSHRALGQPSTYHNGSRYICFMGTEQPGNYLKCISILVRSSLLTMLSR